MPEVREVEPRESQNLGTGANDKPHEAGHTARPELGEVAEDSPEQAQSIWVAGSFWLTSFIVVVTAVFVVSTQVDWYVLPITLAASICVLIVVGALVLTSRGQLEGDKFVQVVVKTLSQLPLLVGARRKRKTEETEEAEKTEDT
jgi:uncharacterized membrane protein YraQ (UPF0718 family)